MKNFFTNSLENKNCIKEDNGEFKIHLNDCLACSGCITDSEDIIKESSLDEIINFKDTLSFIISSQSKWSIYNYTSSGFTFEEFEQSLCEFLKQKFPIKDIYDTSYVKKAIAEELIREDHKIISDCPGTVMYIERQAAHLIKNLSRIPTAQQLLSKNSSTAVVSIVPCYDKKLEATEKETNLSFILTTYEFMTLLVKLDFKVYLSTYKCLDTEKFQMNVGLNTGGYLEYVLFEKYSVNGIQDVVKNTNELEQVIPSKDLSRNNNRDKHMKKEDWTEMNNIKFFNLRDGVDYTFKKRSNGHYIYEFRERDTVETYIRIIGVENLINFMKETKIKQIEYNLVEVYICNYGCINGPGQLKIEDISQSIRSYDSKGNIFDKNNTSNESVDVNFRRFSNKEIRKVKFDVQW